MRPIRPMMGRFAPEYRTMRKLLMVIALLTGSANAADIYYEDGTHVDVPDDWVIVTKPDDCQKSGDGNKSARQEDQIVDSSSDTQEKATRQEDLLD